MGKDDEQLKFVDALRLELKQTLVSVPADISSTQRAEIVIALARGDPIDPETLPSPLPHWFLLELSYSQLAGRRERMARMTHMILAVLVNQLYNDEVASGRKPKLEGIVETIKAKYSVSRRTVFDALSEFGKPEWPVMVAHKKRRTSLKSAAKR